MSLGMCVEYLCIYKHNALVVPVISCVASLGKKTLALREQNHGDKYNVKRIYYGYNIEMGVKDKV